jgi:mannose-6-phosphate isomerase-like protein (cupin superfamily)
MDIVQRDETIPFVTKDGSTIRELLAHRNSSIRHQSLAEALVPPGVRTQPHYHPQTEEIYFILSGTGVMYLANESRSVGPGDAIAIPPEQIHSIENVGTADLVFLCCCAPGYEHNDTVLAESP